MLVGESTVPVPCVALGPNLFWDGGTVPVQFLSLDGKYTVRSFIYTIYTGVYDPGSYTQIYTIISIISVYAPRSFIYTKYTGAFGPVLYTHYTYLPSRSPTPDVA